MKRIVIIGALLLCAAGAYAQGTLLFYNDQSDAIAPIYSPTSTPTVMTQGTTDANLTASGYPTYWSNYWGNTGYTPAQNLAQAEQAVNPTGGPVTYPGSIQIGGSSYSATLPGTPPPAGINTPNLYTYGNLFSAQVYALSAGGSSTGGTYATWLPLYQNGNYSAAVAALPAFSSLQPVTQYITTLATTSGNAGYVIQPSTPSDAGIPGTGWLGHNGAQKTQGYDGDNASVAVAAWYNGNGTITSYAAASAANVPYGHSAVYMQTGLGETGTVNGETGNGAQPSNPPDMGNGNGQAGSSGGGLTSFSLITVPEPSTIALGVMGACAFLARRRKK
jgi:hypothetical protein